MHVDIYKCTPTYPLPVYTLLICNSLVQIYAHNIQGLTIEKFSDLLQEVFSKVYDFVHCKNLRVALTLLWVMSVACSGASIVPSAMSAAISIWTWPPEFLVIYQNGSFTMAIEFLVIYQNGSFTIIIATKFLLFIRTVPLLWPQNFLLFII